MRLAEFTRSYSKQDNRPISTNLIKRRRKRRQLSNVNKSWLTVLIVTSILVVTMKPHCFRVHAQDEYDDYVREVLEEDIREDEQFYDDEDYMQQQRAAEEEYQRQRQAEDEELKRRIKEEEERIAREEEAVKERIALQREKAFEAELKKMNDEQKKVALRQKKKDKRIVQSILKASKKSSQYAVLGIRNWQLKVPSRKIDIPFVDFSITIPGFTILETTAKDIKRAYRNRALQTHPDKNRDGKAQEAFIAVENAASILSDANSRKEYDKERTRHLQQQRNEFQQRIGIVFDLVRRQAVNAISVVRTVLGPFTVPVLILGIIIL